MAELEHNPSYVWCSLLAARDIIIEGSRWQVGDGQTIGVSTHAWLSHSPVFLHVTSHDLRVSDLIDVDSRQWERGKIFSTFARRTCIDILAIPFNNITNYDSLVWKENKAQRFSVKTAYGVVLQLKNHNHSEHSSARSHGETWKKI